jgi:hypothetical protein
MARRRAIRCAACAIMAYGVTAGALLSRGVARGHGGIT